MYFTFQVFHTMKILLLFYKTNIHLDLLIYSFFPLLSCLHAFGSDWNHIPSAPRPLSVALLKLELEY